DGFLDVFELGVRALGTIVVDGPHVGPGRRGDVGDFVFAVGTQVGAVFHFFDRVGPARRRAFTGAGVWRGRVEEDIRVAADRLLEADVGELDRTALRHAGATEAQFQLPHLRQVDALFGEVRQRHAEIAEHHVDSVRGRPERLLQGG